MKQDKPDARKYPESSRAEIGDWSVDVTFSGIEKTRTNIRAQVGDPKGEVVLVGPEVRIVIGHEDVETRCPTCSTMIKFGPVNLSKPKAIASFFAGTLELRGTLPSPKLQRLVNDALLPYLSVKGKVAK